MKNKKIVFNTAILAGDLDVCRKSIRDGLSLESMTGEVKKSPIQEVQLLLDFAFARRGEEFSDEEIFCLVEDRSPESLNNMDDMLGVDGMKQILKEKEQRVKDFRKRSL